jgi:hypothetical protein
VGENEKSNRRCFQEKSLPLLSKIKSSLLSSSYGNQLGRPFAVM